MKFDYKIKTLSEISKKIEYGYTASAKEIQTNHEPKFLRITDIQNGIVDWERVPYCDIEEKKLKQYRLNYGDIVVARTGNSTGENYMYNSTETAIFASYLIRYVINDKEAYPQFIWYQMRSRKWFGFIKNVKSGSAQAGANAKTMGAFKCIIPPLPTQKKIAHILSTLDDKIELNRKMNQTLEDMAQALFKSWFVDFDPVKAKAKCSSDEELEVVAKELGISKEILELFPSEFEDSELGMIPKGWEAKSFGTLLSKTIGGDWGKEEADAKHTEKVKIIRGTDIPKIKQMSIDAVPTRYVESKKLKTREVFDGDIIIEVSGGTKNQPTGRTLYITNEVINMLDGKVEPASFCRLFRPINKEIGLILGQHMLYIYAQGKTWQYQNQSTGISNFQTTIFLDKEYVVVPDINILTKFYDIIRPLIEQSLSSENITLQKTRDTLLPKLLSGEIEVSDIEVEI